MSQLESVVGRFGIAPVRVRRIPRGLVNAVWLVRAGLDTYVLKRATSERATADLAFEHQLLAHLDNKGWRVPRPIPSTGGSTIVEAHGWRWWLAPWLPGRCPTCVTARYGAWAGALLAELHAATADFTESDPDKRRLRLFADWPFHPMRRTFRSRLSSLAVVDGQLASEVEAAAEAVAHRLDDLSGARRTVTHFDFHHDNLRVHRGHVAVLDFDFAHRDEAVADIATALHFTPQALVAEAFVAGYDSLHRLTEAEVAAIPALFDARTLLHVAWLMTQDHIDAEAVRATLRELGSCPLP